VRGGTGVVNIGFHGEGHAVKCAQWLPSGATSVGRVGRSECLVGEKLNDRIDARVDRGDAVVVGRDHLATRHVSGRNQCR
jgi:hypothetical protein